MKRGIRGEPRRVWAALAAALLACSGCYSFSSYQTAHTLQPGEISITPSVSRFQFTYQRSKPEDGDWTVELQARAGLGRNFDCGLKVSRIFLEDGYEFVAIDPKVALVPDRVAFSMPVGTFIIRDLDDKIQIHPTLIFSAPSKGNHSEIAFAAKALIFLDRSASGQRSSAGTKSLLAFDLGARFSTDLNTWAVHPEIGVLFDPDLDGPIFQGGVGVYVKPAWHRTPQ